MRIFQENQKYRIVVDKPKIRIYTARILNEDDLFVKFLDKENKEISLNKEIISEVKKID